MKTLIRNGKLLLPQGSRFENEESSPQADHNGFFGGLPAQAGGFQVTDGDLVLEGERITKILRRGEASVQESFDRVIEAAGHLVMPGLINAHTHAYMSLFRNYADDLEFFQWLDKVQLVEDHLTEEDVYWATMLSIIEMYRTGTTCFVDMTLRSAKNGAVSGPGGAASGAVNDSGIRAYINRGMVGEADDADSLRRFREFFPEIELHRDHSRVNFLLGPHAPYSCMPSLLRKLRDIGKERTMRATVHISESDLEVANMARDHGGITPVQYIDQSGLFEIPVIAAHCVQVTDEDIALLRDRRVHVAINPRSNMKLGNGFAPVEKMLQAGINICLGTDGSGSNNTQNMFQEMNFAGLVYKGQNRKAKCVDAEDVLRFATTSGAKALGMEGKVGEIREGALADLILLDLNVPEFVPQNHLVSALVYAANGSEVDTVLVNGEVVMEHRKLLTIDEKEVYRQCEAITERLGMHTS